MRGLKGDYMKHINILLIMMGLILILSFAGCTLSELNAGPNAEPNQSNHSNNITNDIKYIKQNSWVTVEYTAYLENGSLYDTTNESIALKNDFSRNRFGPEEYIVNDKAPVFIQALIGRKKGDRVTLKLQDKYNKSLVFLGELHYSFNRTETVNRSYLEERNITIDYNTTFKQKTWNVTILNFTNEKVTIRNDPKIGDTFIINGLPEEVSNITNDKIYVDVDVSEGKRFLLPFPNTDELKWATIHDIDEKSNKFLIDFNTQKAQLGKITYIIDIIDVK